MIQANHHTRLQVFLCKASALANAMHIYSLSEAAFFDCSRVVNLDQIILYLVVARCSSSTYSPFSVLPADFIPSHKLNLRAVSGISNPKRVYLEKRVEEESKEPSNLPLELSMV